MRYVFPLLIIGAACSSTVQSPPESAPTSVGANPTNRAVQRVIPMTNAIRRAFAAGTRDSSGRPGRNYWQLRTDYTINARLDVGTSRISGRETVVIRNASPDSLRNIALRLDMNLFLGVTPHLAPWVPAEITDGMVITRMTLDGHPVNLAPPPLRPGATTVTEPSAFGLKLTSARIALANAI